MKKTGMLDDDAMEQVSGGCSDAYRSLVETREATVAMLNAGVDLMAGQGMSQAQDAVRFEGQGAVPFASTRGRSMRAETG